MARSTTKTRKTKPAGKAKKAVSRKAARRAPAARSARQPAAKRAPKGAGGFADVNGLHMYYEVYGKGQPLGLLHGAFSAIGRSVGKRCPCALGRGGQSSATD